MSYYKDYRSIVGKRIRLSPDARDSFGEPSAKVLGVAYNRPSIRELIYGTSEIIDGGICLLLYSERQSRRGNHHGGALSNFNIVVGKPLRSQFGHYYLNIDLCGVEFGNRDELEKIRAENLIGPLKEYVDEADVALKKLEDAIKPRETKVIPAVRKIDLED